MNLLILFYNTLAMNRLYLDEDEAFLMLLMLMHFMLMHFMPMFFMLFLKLLLPAEY